MSGGRVTCPECNTRFRVLPEQLEAARGVVRCGACHTVFRAGDRLEFVDAAETAPPEADTMPAADASRRRSVLGDSAPVAAADLKVALNQFHPGPFYADDGHREAVQEAHGERVETATADAIEVSPSVWDADDLLEFGEISAARPRWPWAVLLGAGMVGLLVQAAFWNFESAALDPRWRPAYAVACAVARCTLPEARDVAAVRSRRLTVSVHPAYRDGLLVAATIESEAAWPQPFPAIELRFTDVSGRLVAARRFAPDEYLAGEVLPDADMFPGQPVRIELELRNPGPQAISYQLSFH